jgi:hypothetical protein
MNDSPATQDTLIRQHVYDMTLALGSPPTVADLCPVSNLPEAEVRASLQRLATGHVLVLQRQSGEILMAMPFSAVPTTFLVQTRRYSAFAPCIWDALGIPGMLGEAAIIRTACGCCGERVELKVGLDGPETPDGVIHFAIPAARWWEDVVFT